jgi:hypothetical protein
MPKYPSSNRNINLSTVDYPLTLFNTSTAFLAAISILVFAVSQVQEMWFFVSHCKVSSQACFIAVDLFVWVHLPSTFPWNMTCTDVSISNCICKPPTCLDTVFYCPCLLLRVCIGGTLVFETTRATCLLHVGTTIWTWCKSRRTVWKSFRKTFLLQWECNYLRRKVPQGEPPWYLIWPW